MRSVARVSPRPWAASCREAAESLTSCTTRGSTPARRNAMSSARPITVAGSGRIQSSSARLASDTGVRFVLPGAARHPEALAQHLAHRGVALAAQRVVGVVEPEREVDLAQAHGAGRDVDTHLAARDAQLRIASRRVGQQRREERRGRAAPDAEHDLAAGLVVELGDAAPHPLLGVEQRTCLLGEEPAGVGEHEPAAGLHQDLDAELLLEQRDVLACRAGRVAERLGGRAERAPAYELPQRREVHEVEAHAAHATTSGGTRRGGGPPAARRPRGSPHGCGTARDACRAARTACPRRRHADASRLVAGPRAATGLVMAAVVALLGGTSTPQAR